VVEAIKLTNTHVFSLTVKHIGVRVATEITHSLFTFTALGPHSTHPTYHTGS